MHTLNSEKICERRVPRQIIFIFQAEADYSIRWRSKKNM